MLAAARATPEGWAEFHRLAVAAGGRAARWATPWDKRMRAQTARRGSIPAHYANGSVEAPLEAVKGLLGARRWTFRNADRMNLLLELARIRYNREPTEDDFAAQLRQQLGGGHRPAPSVADDPRLPDQRVSRSSLRAWIPGQPAHHQRWHLRRACSPRQTRYVRPRPAESGPSCGDPSSSPDGP